jgi:alpha-glucosidase
MARRKGSVWYVGGISASENKETIKKLSLEFLKEGINYRAVLIADSKHDKAFDSKMLIVDKNSTIDVKLLRRGGFVISLTPMGI